MIFLVTAKPIWLLSGGSIIIWNVENLILRNAETADEAFLEDLFFDLRSDEFAFAGLPSEQLKPLMAMQYAAQKQSYKWNFPNAEQFIIEVGGDQIGRLLIARTAEKIQLIDISIGRELRRRGFGSFVLGKLKAEAGTISLCVFKTNSGALNLYEKQDFKIVGDHGMYFEMEWKKFG